MTHRYIGTKEVVAWAADKDGKPGYGVKYADGYTSWSPKEAFEESYRTSEPGLCQVLNFGDALHYLKAGARVSRAGWNGKGLHVRMIHAGNAMDKGDDMKDCFGLSDGNGNIQPGWVASTGDLLANDWQVL
jgi:hypothetical protein